MGGGDGIRRAWKVELIVWEMEGPSIGRRRIAFVNCERWSKLGGGVGVRCSVDQAEVIAFAERGRWS